MALNDTTDRPISRNGRYETAEGIEMSNYMLKILDLHRKDPTVIDRLIGAVKRGERQISYKK